MDSIFEIVFKSREHILLATINSTPFKLPALVQEQAISQFALGALQVYIID